MIARTADEFDKLLALAEQQQAELKDNDAILPKLEIACRAFLLASDCSDPEQAEYLMSEAKAAARLGLQEIEAAGLRKIIRRN